MSSSPYVVTSRQKVHMQECSYAQRIAFPLAWSPGDRLSGDHACSRCLTNGLPEAATTAETFDDRP